jgi:predicted negative regulator of RcsB-dependent stress response
MNNNALYLVVGVLAAVIAVLGYHFYEERQQTTGIEITTSHNGISINKTH